ncbi:disintegrin and metalloproteinase domain-containing protein 1a-like isoform X5 [Canis lupus familiaris]|uniref:disintegrin and metalloproteinase domain-containing protein 1a-like isoform X5 n=1 Tax=Canis lupus familiaris TaxID=9615 RepID=UPI0018F727F3|nr:disintegrin and metalloproteinase domain-containing protein 1a-like isoform X5 [Canis lupus familiaris]
MAISMAASLRHSASLSSLQKYQVVTYEAGQVFQTWAPHVKDLRRALVAPGPLCVRLGVLLLLVLIFLPSLYCDPGSVYYSSYETVIPKSLTAKGREDPGEKASYVLLMQGQKQVIHLKVKRDYFVSNFPVFSYHNGVLGQEMPFISHDCHYEGYIEGVPGSFVSLNTCSGLRGILIREGKPYGIEPMDTSKRFEHVLYTMAHQARVSCNVTSKGSQVVSTSRQQGSREPRSLQAPSSFWSHTKYVEMFVVVNHQRFQMWGSNVNETVQRVMDITALANIFTRGINTEVVLAGMEIWTEGDLIEVPADLRVTLRNFNSWRQEKLFHRVEHDVAHMIVGHHPEGDAGQAFLNGACSGGFATAVESFHHEDVLLFAALMVHELGHNLGIQHDHSACICKDKHFCLMHENITKESGFSNCSSDYFYKFLREHKGACLFNKPRPKGRLRRQATCGNGVLEEDEQCDCGPDCGNNLCCDQTCRLKEQAQCNDGLCCFNCQFRHKGFMCRSALGECDLPEYCDGSSGKCPTDLYKQDGTLCDIIHYCFRGRCKNPDIQCMDIYGSPAVSAPEDCYISMNSKGNRFGNCGCPTAVVPRYVKCFDENIFCGKLVCTNITQVPPIKPYHTVIQVAHKDDWCWSMDAYNISDIPDDGDVHTGTLCAPHKVCMNYSCTDHVVLKYDCEPKEMCNGRGVCNNLKHCHCEAGYAPPDCKAPGNGGSVDSGPPSKSPNNENLSAGGIAIPTKRTSEMKILGKVIFILPAFLLLLLLILIFFISLRAGIESIETPGGSSEVTSETTTTTEATEFLTQDLGKNVANVSEMGPEKEPQEAQPPEEPSPPQEELFPQEVPPPQEAPQPQDAPKPQETPKPKEASPPEASATLDTPPPDAPPPPDSPLPPDTSPPPDIPPPPKAPLPEVPGEPVP